MINLQEVEKIEHYKNLITQLEKEYKSLNLHIFANLP